MTSRVNTKANPVGSRCKKEIPSPKSPKMVTMANEIFAEKRASPYDSLCPDI